MRSVAIVGFAKPSRELANQEPKEVEVWGLNTGHEFLTRYDRWFQLHPKNWKGPETLDLFGRDPIHLEFLKTCAVPVYMQHKDERIPTSIEYPLQAVCESVGTGYFTSSVAYMIGLALHEKVDEIKLFGVNASSSFEYFKQKACIEYLLGLAKGRGIKVTLTPDCPLLKAPLYATDPNDMEMVMHERISQWKGRYMKEWGDWYSTYGAWREALDPERKKFLFQVMESRVADVNACMGGIREAQSILAMFGGLDTVQFNPPMLLKPDDVPTPEPINPL